MPEIPGFLAASRFPHYHVSEMSTVVGALVNFVPSPLSPKLTFSANLWISPWCHLDFAYEVFFEIIKIATDNQK